MPNSNKPLTGIRVLEFGGYIAGPYATSILCALGADVIKVEKPTGEDFRRGMDDKSPYFIQYNAGKRSMAIDLKSAEGIEIIKDLIPNFDVVVENLRPGKMHNLGLGAEHCRKLNNELIYMSVTGFGSSGPLRDRPAYDTIGQAFGGFYTLMNPPSQPGLTGTILADLVTGSMTATGILAALVGRHSTGEGTHGETSILEAVSTLTIDALTQSFELREDPTLYSRHPQAQNFSLQTSSGESLAVHLSNSQHFWERLCMAIDHPDLIEDDRFREYRDRERNHAELGAELARVFKARDYAEWNRRLGEYDVPFAPILSMSGYASHPQVAELELIADQNGEAEIPLVQPPWRFDTRRPERTHATPKIGEHTLEIVREVASDEQVRELIDTGVLFAPVAHHAT